jgi:cytochrome c1
LNGAPNLTVYDPDPAFLRVWLRDPSAVKPGTLMPNLYLSDTEIEMLITFLEARSQ